MNITKESISNVEKLTQSIVNLLMRSENRVSHLERKARGLNQEIPHPCFFSTKVVVSIAFFW